MDDRTRLMRDEEWDRERLKDLTVHDAKDSGRIPEGFAAKVIRQIAPQMQRQVNTMPLAAYLRQRQPGITNQAFEQLTCRTITSQERSQYLLRILGELSGQPSAAYRIVDDLYLALQDSFEDDTGLERHFHVAVKILRPQALLARNIDVQAQEKKEKDLSIMVTKLGSVHVTGENAVVLCQMLKLESKPATTKTPENVNVAEVCQEWLDKSPTASLEDLIYALMCTPGLGREVSKLAPLCLRDSRVYSFFKNLKQHWKRIASYIGITLKEMQMIEQHSIRDDTDSQVQMFLRIWQLPNCGDKTTEILEEVKRRAGIGHVETTIASQPDSKANQRVEVALHVVNLYQNVIAQGDTQAGGACAQHLPWPTTNCQVMATATSLGRVQAQAPPTQLSPPTISRDGGLHLTSAEQKSNSKPLQNESLSTTASEDYLQPSDPRHKMASPTPSNTDDFAAAPQTERRTDIHSQTATSESRECEGDSAHVILPDNISTENDIRNDGMALLAACENSEWDMAEALVKSGSVLTARDQNGRTPLMISCIKVRTAFVKELLYNGADIAAVDSQGHCCLHFSEVLKNQELVDYLIRMFMTMDISVDLPAVENYHTPLMVASMIGDSALYAVKQLLEFEANPDGDSQAFSRPLVEASGRGHMNVVKELLKYRANPDIQDAGGCTALFQACNCSQPEIVELLLECGVSVNRSDYEGTTPLFLAVSANAYSVVQKLIRKGANTNATRHRTNPVVGGTVEETPLAHACSRGFLGIVELLIDSGSDVNYLCSGTVPPVGFAIICKQNHVVQHLLRSNNLDKSIHGLLAPIIIAVKVQNITSAKWLLSELGGEEKARQKAQQYQMHQLVEHIDLYSAMQKGQPDPLPEEDNIHPMLAQQQDSNFHKVQETMQCFCQVCVAAVMNSSDQSMPIKDVAAVADATGHIAVGAFVRRCIDNTQRPESLRHDFLHGDPSPFRFFIENKLLNVEEFQIQALQICGNHAQTFCENLVEAFRQFPGGQSLPNDVRSVLQRLFSGQFGVGLQVGFFDGSRQVTEDHKTWNPYTPSLSGVPLRNHAGPQKAHPNQKPTAQGAQNPPALKRQPHGETEVTSGQNTSYNRCLQTDIERDSPSPYPQAASTALGTLDERMQRPKSHDKTDSIPQTIGNMQHTTGATLSASVKQSSRTSVAKHVSSIALKPESANLSTSLNYSTLGNLNPAHHSTPGRHSSISSNSQSSDVQPASSFVHENEEEVKPKASSISHEAPVYNREWPSRSQSTNSVDSSDGFKRNSSLSSESETSFYEGANDSEQKAYRFAQKILNTGQPVAVVPPNVNPQTAISHAIDDGMTVVLLPQGPSPAGRNVQVPRSNSCPAAASETQRVCTRRSYSSPSKTNAGDDIKHNQQ